MCFSFRAAVSDSMISDWASAMLEVHFVIGGLFLTSSLLDYLSYLFLTLFCFLEHFHQELRHMDYSTLLRVQFEHHSLVSFPVWRICSLIVSLFL